MTQTPAADIVEQATDEEMGISIQEHPGVHPDILRLAISLASDRGGATAPVSEYDIRHALDMIAGEQSEVSRLQSEIEALRAREAELRQEVDAMREKAVSNARERNALQRKLDEAVKAQNEALALIDEINERGASRRFYGIDQPLHAKICTIRATLVIRRTLASIRGETD